MIEDARALLEMEDLPTWEQDAPLRREMIRLKEDIRAYDLAAAQGSNRLGKRAAQVRERADRVAAFLNDRRCGGHAANGYGFRGPRHA